MQASLKLANLDLQNMNVALQLTSQSVAIAIANSYLHTQGKLSKRAARPITVLYATIAIYTVKIAC